MWLPLRKMAVSYTPGLEMWSGRVSGQLGTARHGWTYQARTDLYGFADSFRGRSRARSLESPDLSRAAWAQSYRMLVDQAFRGDLLGLRKWPPRGGPQEPHEVKASPELTHQSNKSPTVTRLLTYHHFGQSATTAGMIDAGCHACFRARAATRLLKCSYPILQGFTEEVVNLTQWFERMETVFRISNCTVENQVKFATCTLMGTALTWWNSHARTVTNDVAYAMTWSDLKKKMTTKYCPRNEIKKIEAESLDKIERYVGGMPDPIYSSVVASKPKTMQEAIEMATGLMERRAYAAGKNGDRIPFEG
ncbi:reverse transcriptase domain-containing protein [Tanacetum coccineum]